MCFEFVSYELRTEVGRPKSPYGCMEAFELYLQIDQKHTLGTAQVATKSVAARGSVISCVPDGVCSSVVAPDTLSTIWLR